MLVKQEFASSSFYYSISHEFFIAQAPDPANTHARAQHSAEGACCLHKAECLSLGKPQEHVACVETFSCLGIWDLQLMTAKRSLALEVTSLSAQNCRILPRCYVGYAENYSFLKILKIKKALIFCKYEFN